MKSIFHKSINMISDSIHLLRFKFDYPRSEPRDRRCRSTLRTAQRY
ncbi:hypothetical protein HanXRQr2_Chr03g0101431 [Helianthus annuus]|uniref:Uncharacterized protein n=1 Tax=Helianthus annuus TaxID=4232 RepID=A0A9K3NVJ0_HELAN|nr:hypothetical protein HanXRQr2_Chr03g0101431 [Helianthus annuus]KAJ0942899.1 hypothetical protein HanPSC8_Chr03g0097671 [Helianthus annuus]